MSKSNVDGVTEAGRFNLHPGSPEVEEEDFSWGLKGKLVDTSLKVVVIHFFFDSQTLAYPETPPTRNHLVRLILPSPLALSMVRSYYCTFFPQETHGPSFGIRHRLSSVVHNREKPYGYDGNSTSTRRSFLSHKRHVPPSPFDHGTKEQWPW